MAKGSSRTVYRREDKKWVDKRNDAERGFLFNTQKEAIESAKQKLDNAGGGELSVKGLNGRIRSKDTIGDGNDPNPPKDKEH